LKEDTFEPRLLIMKRQLSFYPKKEEEQEEKNIFKVFHYMPTEY